MNGLTGTTFEDWKLVLLSPWGTTGLVLALVGLVAALALTLWSYRRQPRRSVRVLLGGLRFFSLAAVLAVVLQPAIQLRSVTQIPNHVAVLLDLSRSMEVRESTDGASRLERAQALLERSAGRISDWSRQRLVDLFSFGSQVKGLERKRSDLGRLKGTEPATRTRNALAKVRQIYQGKDLAAVILISDGIDNGRFGTGPLSLESKKFLESLQLPVHTVWVGGPEIRDISVAEVHADEFAFVRNAVQVEVDLIVIGFDRTRIPVALEGDSGVVAQRELEVSPAQTLYRVRFEFVPEKVGKYVYRIATPLRAGEALRSNNSQSFVLRVIRDRVRVLQVCGRPSWDQRFLRQLLKRDPNIDLISFFILRTPTDLYLVPTSELSLIPFPTEELFEKELGSFDLIVLQNFNYRPYGIGTYLPHLRQFVLQGGGLAMLGGDLSFSSGGYYGTPLAEVLPLKLLPPPSDLARIVSEEDFRPSVTAEGVDHPVLQLGRTRKETQQILATLPVLSGVNLVDGPAAGGTVLAVHPQLKDRGGAPMPVLATREVGKGRTLALTTDSSWHWAFLAVGQGETRQAYDKLWRNVIRWLIQDPELKYLRVIVQRDTVRLGDQVRATIRAYNPDYSPARGLEVTYRAHRIEEESKEAPRVGHTNDEGELHLELAPMVSGVYRISASAVIGGLRTDEDALVLVTPAGPEEREPRATDVLLRRIAATSGGRYLGRPSSLPDLSFREPRMLRVNWRRDVELWSRWWSLLACLFFLGMEWSLRRKFGYL